MVLSIIDDVTTYYPNSSYEKRVEGATETVLKYYFAGSTRIAMRENETITWLLGDHLGSTSVTADASGNLLSSESLDSPSHRPDVIREGRRIHSKLPE